MAMSDRIEAFILELLKEDEDWLEIGRNELASVFNCVPSQINYVIATRFSPDRGYMVESRRGGGGYLRIRRMATDDNSLLIEAIRSTGDSIDYRRAFQIVDLLSSKGIIDEKSKNLIMAAICERSLPAGLGVKRDEIRAGILKNMLTVIC